MSLIIGFIMTAMDRDRNIAMGIGSNTNAAATITRSVKDLIQIKYSSIQRKQ